MEKKYTAIIIGATGLVGSQLVQLLLKEERFSAIKIFSRRPAAIQHSKVEEHLIDFDKPENWMQFVTGDVLFSALGTTIKQAGSRRAQYKVDYTYQYNFAKAAAQNGVPVYVLVSSAMASQNSKLFYTRIKGELERDIKQLPFKKIHIIQPGMLVGKRKENRIAEKIGIALIRFLNLLGIVKKQKPIDAGIVAQAMLTVSFKKEERIQTYSLLQVFEEAAIKK